MVGASQFVGRVGGLALALGVGAAVFAGPGVAWADRGDAGGTSGANTASASSADNDSSPPRGPRAARGSDAPARPAATRKVPTAAADRTTADTEISTETSTETPSAPVDPIPVMVEERVSPDLPVAAPVAPEPTGTEPELPGAEPQVLADPVLTVADPAVTAPGNTEPEAVPAADLTSFSTGLAEPSGGAGSDPSVPIDSPLAAALLAYSRRAADSASATGGPAALATTTAVTNNGVTVDPKVTYYDGILQGNLNASSAGGRELTYTFVTSSAGGKAALNNVPAGLPYGGVGSFTLLPYATWIDPANPTQNPTPSGSQQFTIRVSENTAFDQFVVKIPLVGLLAEPIISILQQTPFISALLAPLIGGSVTADIVVDVATLVPAGEPVAFTYLVDSFDGTPISTNFFPADPASRRAGTDNATLFNGPGLGSPGNIDPYGFSQAAASSPGLGVLRGVGKPETGFNVITWAPRGEGESGGVLQFDNPFFEGRDVSALIDWASANTPLWSPGGKPAIGMIGGSYGGGIQLTTVDPRIKAIVPAIAWHSLNQSLYPDDIFKTGWVNLLYLALVRVGASVNDQIPAATFTGNLFGFVSETAQAVLASSGPTSLLTKLSIPTMYVQGIPDSLFPLQQAVANAQTQLEQNPYFAGANADQITMIWFCGGHGQLCLDPVDPVEQAESIFGHNMYFLNKYVKDAPLPDTIPTFQWWDQTGDHYVASHMPFADGFRSGAVSATSTGGSLGILPFAWLGSGPNTENCPYSAACEFPLNNTYATPAKNALDVDITVPTAGTQIVGAPTVSFTYTGWGTAEAVYGQIIDNATGRVLGNIVAPIPVTLDGKSHTVSVPIADIVYTAPTDNSSLTLQIVGGATLYQNGKFGSVNIKDVRVDLPTTTAGTKV